MYGFPFKSRQYTTRIYCVILFLPYSRILLEESILKELQFIFWN